MKLAQKFSETIILNKKLEILNEKSSFCLKKYKKLYKILTCSVVYLLETHETLFSISLLREINLNMKQKNMFLNNLDLVISDKWLKVIISSR